MIQSGDCSGNEQQGAFVVMDRLMLTKATQTCFRPLVAHTYTQPPSKLPMVSISAIIGVVEEVWV